MKNILIFNDISGLGNCSMSANLPVFTTQKYYCMPVVTATFSCQTGFKNFVCQPNSALTQSVQNITQNRIPDGIFVGFGVNVDLLSQITSVVQSHPQSCIFVDPILGDNGSLYSIFNDDYVAAMKALVPYAHCISPNLTEACLLCGVDYNSLVSHKNEPAYLATCGAAFANILQQTGAQNAVVTGVEFGNYIGNIVYAKGLPVAYVTNERVPVNYSGTGDAFSSVLFGQLLGGASLLNATQVAANFVAQAAKNTDCPDRRFGINLGSALHLLK